MTRNPSSLVSLAMLVIGVGSALAPPARAAERAVVVGDGPVLTVEAPKGWRVDSRSGLADGLPLIAYPRDGSWEAANAVMYVRTFTRGEKQTLESFVEDDAKRAKAESSKCRIQERAPIKTSDGGRALVRQFSRDRWGNHETVAYLEGSDGFVLVVLSGRESKSHGKADGAFHDLVRSMHFVTAQDGLASYVTACRNARRNAATEDGRKLGTAVGEEMQKTATVRECARGIASGDRNELDLLLCLAADGSVEEVLVRPDSKAAECLRTSLQQSRFSRPPQPSYWIRVALGVAEGGSRASVE